MTVRLRIALAPDCPALLRVIDDPDVAFWLFAGGPPQGMFYLQPVPASGAGPVYVAESAADGRIIGGGRIEREGFSYFVCKAEWCKGYGTQVANLMLAEFRLRRSSRAAVLSIKRENAASIRIMERLGFRFAGLNGSNPATLKFVDRSVT